MSVIVDFLSKQGVSITRAMAASLADLERRNVKIHHLGAGMPHPQVGDILKFRDQVAVYERYVADAQGVSLSKLLSPLYGYTDTLGRIETRKLFAQIYGEDFGFSMDPNHLTPSIGSTNSIDLLCSLFEQGDKKIAYIVDAPTYPGFLARAKHPKAQFFSVELDQEGPDPEKLRAKIKKAREAGCFVAFYYTIPDGHNPAGISFSQKRREEIYAVLREENILLVEDAPYTYISFASPDKRPKPFIAMDPDGRVVHLFTASKIGFPGQRVAFIYAPGKLKIADGTQEAFLSELVTPRAAVSFLMHNPKALFDFEAYLHNDSLRPRKSLWPIARQRTKVYQQNRDILLEGLSHYFNQGDDISWSTPEAGFFSVLKFDRRKLGSCSELAARLLEGHRVMTIPMSSFYAPDIQHEKPGIGEDELRLAFSYTAGTGVKRIREMEAAIGALGEGLIKLAS